MKRALRFLPALALGSLSLVAARPASAQVATGYATNHYAPSERGSRWFVSESLDLRGDGRFAFGAVGDSAYRTFVHYRGGEVFRSVVRNQGTVHFGGSVVFGDRFRLGLNVPLQVFADGNSTQLNGVTFNSPSEKIAVGDARVGLDMRLFGTYGEAITGAFGAQLYLPSGSPDAYTGDGNPRVAPRFMVAGESGMFAYAGRLGMTIRGRDEAFGDARIGSDVFLSAAAGVQLLDKKLLIGPELWGSTVVSKGAAFEGPNTPVEAMLGAHWDVIENVRLGAAASTGISRGVGASVLRGLFSLEWVPGSPTPPAAKPEGDTDGDGVPDNVDACPFAAGPRSDIKEKNGCPIPDLDKDGIPDAEDACSCIPGIRTADPKTNGCPPDADGDGIPDPEDACPQEPGKRSSDPKLNGCPDQDRDKDGIMDASDACPDVPGVANPDPKLNGCPADKDGDGIPDAEDACPDEAGQKDPDPKKNGCPKAVLQGGQIRISDQVRFAFGKADIVPGPESEGVLEAVAAVLKDHPEIKKIRVEGHTDDRGNRAGNVKLSKARADSVAAWLASHGVDKSRLETKGFGPDRPLDSNGTEDGRTKNRRVEFHVADGPGKN